MTAKRFFIGFLIGIISSLAGFPIFSSSEGFSGRNLLVLILAVVIAHLLQEKD